MAHKLISISDFLSESNQNIDDYFNEEFLQNMVSYINNTLIPNLLTNNLEDDLNVNELHQFHKLFYNEICFILFKLCRLFEKNRSIGEFVMIDLKNPWFRGEKMINLESNDENTENPFSNNKIMSQILTICTKIIDLIAQVYETKIAYINEKIQAVTDLYELFFQKHYGGVAYILDTEYHIILDAYNHEYMKIWEISKMIRSYYISLFYHVQFIDNDIQNQYYHNIPECIFNIFVPSIYFISGDGEFIDFIQNIYSSSEEIKIPLSFRYKYLLTYYLNATDTEMILLNRNDIMIDDIIYLYNKFKLDNSNIFLECSVQILNILNTSKLTVNYINSDKLINLSSIICSYLLEISNLQNLKDKSLIIKYSNIMLSYINYILHECPQLLNTYLVYYIPKCILTVDKSLLTLLNMEYVIDIYGLLLNHKYGIYYLISLMNNDDIILIKMNLPENMRTLIANISDKLENSESIDEITCQPIIVPFYLPPKNILCDRYMTESYLWNKSENPYTREPLTINQLNEYNNSPEIFEQMKKTSEIIQSHFSYQ